MAPGSRGAPERSAASRAMFYTGTGVTQDGIKAARLFKLAGDQGHKGRPTPAVYLKKPARVCRL